MAGRPLRRARVLTAMNNPLTGWEDTSGMTAGTAVQMLVPLVKPGARETFEHGYRNVPVPIALALRPPSWYRNMTWLTGSCHIAIRQECGVVGNIVSSTTYRYLRHRNGRYR